jgi:hypothetical protein
VIDIDAQIDFAVSLVLRAQGITRGRAQEVMAHYVAAMRGSMRAKVTGETRAMSDALMGAWSGRVQYPPVPELYAGRDAVRMRRRGGGDPERLAVEALDTMKFAIKNISDADEDLDEAQIQRSFASDIALHSVRWTQEDEVIMDGATMQPYEWRFEKRTSAEFAVRGEPHTSMSLLMKNTLMWDDDESGAF